MSETDVIILGCGAAGMAAALAAHETGAEVALIERFERIGGTSAISGGVIWVPDNPRQRAAGMSDGREEALAYFRSLDHGDLVDETLEAFVDRGPEALAFLEQLGALKVALLEGYPDYYLDRPGAKPEGGRALDHDLFALGELGEWAGKITAIEEPKPMMLRETPLGGAPCHLGYREDRVLNERRQNAQILGILGLQPERPLATILEARVVGHTPATRSIRAPTAPSFSSTCS